MDLIENPYTILLRRLSRIESLCNQIISDQKKNPPIVVQPEEYLDAGEAGQLLKLSKSRVYHLSTKGKLPGIKRGNRLLFKKTDLIKFLEDGKLFKY